jgi:hypothetical protein
MPEATATVLAFLGQIVVAGGGGAVAAYLIFQHLGKAWVQHELAKSLEAAKSEISIASARRLKLYDKEYVVFPELWAKLNKALNGLKRAIGSFRSVPDLDRMGDDELSNWLNKSDLSEHEKTFFASQKNKGNAYNKILEFRDLAFAHKDYLEFHVYLKNNRIFLRPILKAKLNEIDDLLWRSWISKKMDLDGIGRGESLEKAWGILDDQIKPLIVEIEELVQSQLFPEKT